MAKEIDLSGLPEDIQDFAAGAQDVRDVGLPLHVTPRFALRLCNALALVLEAGRALREEAETKKRFQGGYGHFSTAVAQWDDTLTQTREMGDG